VLWLAGMMPKQPQSKPETGSPRHATASRAAGRSILAGLPRVRAASADDPRGFHDMSCLSRANRFFLEGREKPHGSRSSLRSDLDIPTKHGRC
jgi:hypothetical protein